MGYFEGLKDFLSATSYVLSTSDSRAWFFKRVLKSLFFGTLILSVLAAALGYSLWQIYENFSPMIEWTWLASVAGALLVGIWIIVFYFSCGPITLILMGLYMTQNGDWEEIRRSLPVQFPPLQENASFIGGMRALIRSVWLILIIVFGMFLSLIPILFFVGFFASAYALGKDWAISADNLVPASERKPTNLWYLMGLGTLPTLLATIPILGVTTIPILQVAGLIRYEESTKLYRE